MRAVIYARYSTDLQREASIEDQVRICRQLHRPGGLDARRHLQRRRDSAAPAGCGRATRSCWRTARAGHFDVVVAEALDRLSPRPGGHRRPVQAAAFRAACGS